MNDEKMPPAQRTLRKSVSFCLPNDDDLGKQEHEENKIPDRLLLQQHVRRSSSSTSSSHSLSRMRVLSAPSRPTPSPPVDKAGMPMKRFGGQRPTLTRSLSVPTGLTLANVLTQQRNETLVAGGGRLPNIRSRRYSSSSLVKQRMMRHTEKEFNRVAAKVSDFCRRVDSQASVDQQTPSGLTADCDLRRVQLRPLNSAVDPTGSQTITHHGRRYRASFSLSSNSMDDHSDHLNNGYIQDTTNVRKQEQSSTPYDHPITIPTTTINNNIAKEGIEPVGETVDEYVNCNGDQDDNQSELNDRISKWLDEVNNSVVQMSISDQSDESGDAEITVIPL